MNIINFNWFTNPIFINNCIQTIPNSSIFRIKKMFTISYETRMRQIRGLNPKSRINQSNFAMCIQSSHLLIAPYFKSRIIRKIFFNLFSSILILLILIIFHNQIYYHSFFQKSLYNLLYFFFCEFISLNFYSIFSRTQRS